MTEQEQNTLDGLSYLIDHELSDHKRGLLIEAYDLLKEKLQDDK